MGNSDLGFDIIGDIHGHADQLRALLVGLGYTLHGRGYRHPDRKVLFVGDFIDRGPAINDVLEIVRSMVDANVEGPGTEPSSRAFHPGQGKSQA